ncbi:MAG: hypothetical protein U0547_04655 [Dehalococcoidia bacterium]
MTWVGCEETMGWLSRAFAEPRIAEELRALRAARAEPAEYIRALAEVAEAGQRSTLIEEFRALPAFTVAAIVEAWAMADTAAMPFVLESVKPARPLEAARRKQVTLSIASDADGVHVGLAHVATRHAEWYQPA